MMRTSLTRSSGIAALALATSLGLAACGSEQEMQDSRDAESSESTEMSESPSEEMSESPMESEDSMDAPAAQAFGPGCSAIPSDGAGSFDGMASEPVATAASNNPLLKTLVTAVGEADLVDTLNSADGITVFAPTDDAFGAIPEQDLNALLKDQEMLTQVLTHHVVPGQLSPADVAGEHETLNGDMLTVEGSGEEFTVGDEEAAVLCGNIPTANATVYVVDSVLMP